MTQSVFEATSAHTYVLVKLFFFFLLQFVFLRKQLHMVTLLERVYLRSMAI